jgi:hypothetical protein
MSREDDRRRNSRGGSRTARLRERVNAITPEDDDMIELIGVLKGILDIVDDIAREGATDDTGRVPRPEARRPYP